jgi:hypothetical protein
MAHSYRLTFFMAAFIVWLGLAKAAQCDSWVRTYGQSNDDYIHVIKQTSDGGYIFAGKSARVIDAGNGFLNINAVDSVTGQFSAGVGQYDGWIVKLNASGIRQWEKRFGKGDFHFYDSHSFTDLVEVPGGGYVLAGTAFKFDFGGSSTFVMKINSSGNEVWDKYHYGSRADSILRTPDGGFLLAGTRFAHEEGGGAGVVPLVIKLDANGDYEWHKTYGNSSDAQYIFRMIASTGGYLVSGKKWVVHDASKNEASYDGWIFKINSNGDLLWEKTYGGTLYDCVNDLTPASNGGYVAVGVTTPVSGNAGSDAWVFKINENGGLVWDRNFGHQWNDSAFSVSEREGGGYLVGGFIDHWIHEETITPGASRDAWVFEVDANGNQVWSDVRGSRAGGDWIHCVIENSDADVIAAGTTESMGAGDIDGWVLKYDGTSLSYPSLSVPTGTHAYEYPSRVLYSLSSNPSLARPLAFGQVENGTLSVQVGLPEFNNHVDVYLGFYAPALASDVFLFWEDGNVKPLSAGLVPWRANTAGPVDVSVIPNLSLRPPFENTLPGGTYYFYLLATPVNSLESFYFWSTDFEVR